MQPERGPLQPWMSPCFASDISLLITGNLDPNLSGWTYYLSVEG